MNKKKWLSINDKIWKPFGLGYCSDGEFYAMNIVARRFIFIGAIVLLLANTVF